MINHYQKWPRQSYPGMENPHAKLTKEDVGYIRAYHHVSAKRLANAYGVTVATIHNIRAYRTWKHVD